MIIVGDLSGIQSYLFDVPESGGGQARRLRARSLYIQLLAEAAILRILDELEWSLNAETVVLSAGGRFVLRERMSADSEQRLIRLDGELNQWLLSHTTGELRLSLAWSCDETETQAYRAAVKELQHSKLRPWKHCQAGMKWNTAALCLNPLHDPCPLCRRRPAETPGEGDETISRMCRQCRADSEMGRLLPTARWLTFERQAGDLDQTVFDFGIRLSSARLPTVGPQVRAVSNLDSPDDRPPTCPAERFLPRRLVAHLPTTERGESLDFTDIARYARGAPVLAVLKADVDSLGARLGELLDRSSELQAFREFSDRLDRFFTSELQSSLRAHDRWKWIYAVYAGGDDLLLVGPWNIVLEFAGHIRESFLSRFPDLTLSAGIALFKHKEPVLQAVTQADELLHQAKSHRADAPGQPKDNCAAFGQIWKWRDHQLIVETATRLANWADIGVLQRGWLHTWLNLYEQRHPAQRASAALLEAAAQTLATTGELTVPQPPRPDLTATSRLAWQISRNAPRRSDPHPERKALRAWLDGLLDDFDHQRQPMTTFLPTILRYALLATRAPEKD